MDILRKYKVKDVEMVVSGSTIVESAIDNKEYLQSKRATWTDEFFDNLKTRLDAATQNYLGVDSAKELRESTAVIRGISKSALKDLAEAKVQIIEDFKNDKPRRDEIVKQLGFSSYHEAAQDGDQEGLINLLFQFKKNLPGLKNEIVEKGTAAALLDGIITYTDTLKDADVTQETFKGSKKIITETAIKEFNGIYDSVISICKIATNLYKEQPAIQQQFSFNKVSKALNASPQSTKKTKVEPK